MQSITYATLEPHFGILESWAGRSIPTEHKQAVAERIIAGSSAMASSLSVGLQQHTILKLQRSFHGAMLNVKRVTSPTIQHLGTVASHLPVTAYRSPLQAANYVLPGSVHLLSTAMDEQWPDDDDGWDDEDDNDDGNPEGNNGGTGDSDWDGTGYDADGDEYEESWPEGTVTINGKTMSMCSAYARVTALGAGSFGAGLAFLKANGTPYAPVILGIETDPAVLILVVALLAAYAGYLAAIC